VHLWENILAKIGLELVAFPMLLGFYLASAKKTVGGPWARWAFKNVAFYLLLGCLGLGVFIEVRRWRYDPATHPEDKPLRFFPAKDYLREISAFPQAKLPDNSRDALLRKFEHTQYAWEKKDYDEVIRQLTQIKAGKDDAGSLQVIPSFVVENDLACAIFMVERNKGFKACRAMQNALEMCPINDPGRKDVESNFHFLDQMVNRLD
jgi:hypothetical protein